MGHDVIHPQVLKKLVDVIVRPLSIILDKSQWLREVSEDWRKTNATSSERERDSGNYGVNQPHLNSWESDIGANSGIFFQVLREHFSGLLHHHLLLCLSVSSHLSGGTGPCALCWAVLAQVHCRLRLPAFPAIQSSVCSSHCSLHTRLPVLNISLNTGTWKPRKASGVVSMSSQRRKSCLTNFINFLTNWLAW